MKSYIPILLAMVAATAAQGQNIHFSFADGTQQSYALQNVRKTVFTEDVMNLYLTDGTIYSWNIVTIDLYQFNDLTSAGDDLQRSTLPPIKVYPNPTTGLLTVEYVLDSEMLVSLEIFDIQGRSIRKMELGIQHAGIHTTQWDGRNTDGQAVVSGSYLCHIITPRAQMSRNFIIQY
jgi:hypothetical protein